MRWTIAEKPQVKVGDWRVHTKFLWLPVKIDREIRWGENTCMLQIRRDGYWEAVAFVDGNLLEVVETQVQQQKHVLIAYYDSDGNRIEENLEGFRNQIFRQTGASLLLAKNKNEN